MRVCVCVLQLDVRGRIVTAEVSFAEKAAAIIAADMFHGVSVHSKRGRERYT